jgi:apolipoprotein N-acyltransferase
METEGPQPVAGRSRRRVIAIVLGLLLLLTPVLFIGWSVAWNQATDLCVLSEGRPPGRYVSWTWWPPGFVCHQGASRGRIVEERRIEVWEVILRRENS